MNLYDNPVAVVGSSCRLPGDIKTPSDLWNRLVEGDWEECSTPAPPTRGLDAFLTGTNEYANRGGWLGQDGVENFDASFFGISPGEAESLRPNARLALELTWEALENAGIAPADVRGKNVSVSIGIGTEDGWDMRRFWDDNVRAFDHNWAQSSDPSAVAGRVAHFFDFHGAVAAVSGACASGANAMECGINSLLSQEADVAIVGGITTHFTPAPFLWASSVRVLSQKGRCSAFSPDADGYVPSEGAVFFVLKRSDIAIRDGDAIDGLIKGIALRHNGSTRTLATPNTEAQKLVTSAALNAAHLKPEDVLMLEAHGTGTVLGDMIEMEAVRSLYGKQRSSPLYVTSSKTVLGHCQAAAALVGVLKALLCFRYKTIPPHHVQPYEDCCVGDIRVPTESVTLPDGGKPFIAAVSSFGFTGGIASVVLEEPPFRQIQEGPTYSHHLLTFSGKSRLDLEMQINSTRQWLRESDCTVAELAAILSLSRDHHPVRRALVVRDLNDFQQYSDFRLIVDQPLPASFAGFVDVYMTQQNPEWERHTDVVSLVSQNRFFHAAAILYENGYTLDFSCVYDKKYIRPSVLRSFPTYPFQRRRWWRHPTTSRNKSVHSHKRAFSVPDAAPSFPSRASKDKPKIRLSVQGVRDVVSVILHRPAAGIDPDANIYDVGIDSLNSIELAQSLSTKFGVEIGAVDLYNLLTIRAITDFMTEDKKQSPQDRQGELNACIEEFGAPLVPRVRPKITLRGSATTILVTGATGFLGCEVLMRLLSLTDINIVCLIRGDPEARLRKAFSERGGDMNVFDRALEERRLQPVRITDLAHAFLGCSSDDYGRLIETVDVVVHGAWKVDFNFTLEGFRPDLTATRSVAQFCVACDRPVALHFITSFSTTFGYDASLVPEHPLEPKVHYALDQGYAVSKLVAEHALYLLHDREPSSFHLRIIRVGQICGHSKTGVWNKDEMIPMIIASLPILQVAPRCLPEVSWIPSNTCAAAICDLIKRDLGGPSDGRSLLSVFNLANANIVPWLTVIEQAASVANCESPRLVSLDDYVQAIQDAQASRAAGLTVSRLLPSFYASLSKGGFPEKYCSLDVTHTSVVCPSLASCPPIDRAFVELLAKRIFDDWSSASQVAPADSSDRESNAPMFQSGPNAGRYTFMFGPWTGPTATPSAPEYVEIEERLLSIASNVAPDLDDQAGSSDASTCDMIDNVRLQLRALAHQLYNVQRLTLRGIRPDFVLGYCFGEYAAAITSGYVTESEAVTILTYRALAIWRSLAQDQSDDESPSQAGAMLNVFASIQDVRMVLARLATPHAEIAIHAGPRHVVLSGTVESVNVAQKVFGDQNIRCMRVDTSLPFHSRAMDRPVQLLEQSYLKDMRPVATMKQDASECLFVSGLTARVLPQKRLSPKYWLRHMREPVRFFESMQTALSKMVGEDQQRRRGAKGWTIVDVGPGTTLSRIVQRYDVGWDDMAVASADRVLESTQGSVPSPKKSTRRARPAPIVTRVPSARTSTTSDNSSPTTDSPATVNSPTYLLTPGPLSSMLSSSIELEKECLKVLASMFHYKSESSDLLHESVHSLGMDSLSFVRFSNELKSRAGIALPPSAYTSNKSLNDLLKGLL